MEAHPPTRMSERPIYSDGRHFTAPRNRMAVPAAGERALDQVRRYLRRHPDADPTPCPCGAGRDAALVERDRNGLPCRLRLCRACGLIRMDPQPTEEALAWLYAEHYRAIHGPHVDDPDALFASMAWKGRLVEDALRAAGVELGSGPVVDLGCGGGWVLLHLRRPGLEVLGYDFDQRLLELGRARGLDVRRGGAEQARADGVRARVLIVAHVLEHTKDPVAHLRSLRPLVEPDGRLYLEVPHIRRIGATLLGDSMLYWQRAHLWDFQRGHLEVLARRAGWRPVHGGEDALSAHLLCEPGDEEPELPFPPLGDRVAAELRAHERLRRSPLTRARRALRAAVRLLRRCQRRFQLRC